MTNIIQWTGENCIEISDFLGSNDFHHKNSVLYINTPDAKFSVKKEDYFGKNDSGIPFPYIDPHADTRMDSITESYNAAINFALDELSADDGHIFLEMWREGGWKEIANEFPEFNLETTNQCDKNGNLLPLN